MAKELAKQYDPKGTEDRIYQEWCDKGYFHTQIDRSKKPFTIVMPPPNVTGQLHMGHAMDETWQDILTRYKRMQGYAALWALADLKVVGVMGWGDFHNAGAFFHIGVLIAHDGNLFVQQRRERSVCAPV